MHKKIMHEIDLYEIPVEALKPRTIGKLCCMLNKIKILSSPEPLRLPRDYRGIAHLMGISTLEGWLGERPIEKLLMVCGVEKNLSLGELQSYFEKIDRYDVLDDTKSMFYDDAEEYENKRSAISVSKIQDTSNSNVDILTMDDIINLQKGAAPQIYDAFILYVDSDKLFAQQIVRKMEEDLHFKVCDRNRDFIPGLPFNPTATIKLISARCHHLLVIFSDEFMKQTDCHAFFNEYVAATISDQGFKKVIFCTYKLCNLPAEYENYVVVNYEKDLMNGSFWNNFQNSLQRLRIENIPLGGDTEIILKHENVLKSTGKNSQSITKRIQRLLFPVKKKSKNSKKKEVVCVS